MAKKQTKGANEAQDTTPETTIEIAETPAPKKTRKPKAEVVVGPETPAPIEPAPKKRAAKTVAAEAEVAAEPTPKKTKRTKSSATLQDVFAGYVKDLEERGSSDGTVNSYKMELQVAGDDLGLETPIAEITPERVLLFFTSDRVVKKRNGKSKSPLSIDKTRRVLRQALTWAQTAKLIAEAPVPELAASH